MCIKEPIQYTRGTDLPSQDLELICAEIQPPKRKSYTLIARYRPPSDPGDSFNKLETILSYLDQEGKEIILPGDTNCDFTKKAANRSNSGGSRYFSLRGQVFEKLGVVEIS